MAKPAWIPLSVPDLRGREAEYLAQCVADNWVSSAGPFVTELEVRMASLAGRDHAVATVNGTTALHLALIAAGVGRGDRVIVPDWTFGASTNAIYHAGGEPYFVDVTLESWTLDPELVADVVADRDNRVRAVIAVHALGHPADMEAIRTVAGDLPVIEDAAGAIGATYKGRRAGGLGDFGVFSFNGNKTVTAGGGGMVLTDDETSAKRIRHLSTQARPGSTYVHDAIGFNYRMTNLNAAVGLAQLERLDDMVAARRRIAARYDDAITGRDDVAAMPRTAWAESSCWLYSLKTASATDAGSLIDEFAKARIEARTFWESLAGQAPYRSAPSRLTGISESLSGTVVSLPCSSHLTGAEQDRVVAALAAWRGAALEKAA
ncbi:MAG: aminotransferase class I/II-fold pyridoxal phosphate-dependent enzyme [Alphaproteobacteria bacterium]|nr:aminotransferase class I/II-fold pyridoxal phosphate-dependent enzyme [Alphaproteobacteria bacterium]